MTHVQLAVVEQDAEHEPRLVPIASSLHSHGPDLAVQRFGSGVGHLQTHGVEDAPASRLDLVGHTAQRGNSGATRRVDPHFLRLRRLFLVITGLPYLARLFLEHPDHSRVQQAGRQGLHTLSAKV